MRFFRQSSHEQLPVSIAGIKLGNRVLMLGCGDPKLFAQLAVKTGLTGRACVLDADAARTERAAIIATHEGALVEPTTTPWTSLPFNEAAFDVAIVRDVFGSLDPSIRMAVVGELARVLRPGGRCLVIDSTPKTGLASLVSNTAALPDYDAPATLQGAAFRAVRTVAERDGLRFVEGVKENTRR